MPFISRVVEKEKSGSELKIVVRITGVGGRDGPMKYRAKARALLESGFLPHYSKDTDENPATGFDEGIDTGPMEDVKQRIKTARQESGVFAQLDKVMSVRTEKELSQEKVEEVFGRGFFGVVDTMDYHFLVSTSYSF